MKQEEPRKPGDALGWLYAFASAHSTALTVFTRHSFGVEALGWNGLFALLLIFTYAGLAQAPEMLGFLFLWVVALIVQRIITAVRVTRGWVEHSRYTGWPFLAMRVPFVRREVTAKAFEALLFGAVGALLLPLSQALGTFVMLGFFSTLVKQGLEAGVDRRRARAMRDAQLDQQRVTVIFHGRPEDD